MPRKKDFRYLNYDASYLSRIRSGQRHPTEPEKLIQNIAQYIVQYYHSPDDRDLIASLIKEPSDTFTDSSDYQRALMHWLCFGEVYEQNPIEEFLQKLDEFDLKEYIRVIHFDQLKVPSVPFLLPTSRNYFGLQDMMNCDLDFLKATVLSKSMEDVIMYSDMPIAEMGRDPEFPKKWMYGMALMLKKGLHLHMIPEVHRPFEEMMFGLESWIPMYMTGQVSPYYLKTPPNDYFHHLIKISGTTAMSGEAIVGYHKNGKYYLTRNKNEIAYYKTLANDLLKKAQPLMEIYRSDSAEAFSDFLQQSIQIEGPRRSILSYASLQRKQMDTLLENSCVSEEYTQLTREELEQFPVSLSLSGIFYEEDLFYTYEEFQEHLMLTNNYAHQHGHYTAKANVAHAFRNLQITICKDHYVLISKTKSPVIHFVIRHPKMLYAIEHMVTPVIEDSNIKN